MKTTEPNPKADAFFDTVTQWKEVFVTLRGILLETGLTEELKWGWPCYALDGANIVLMHGFKDYCALLFLKGALMADTQGILVRQTVNVQASRQIRFTDDAQVRAMTATLRDYLREAIRVEKAGLDISWKHSADYAVPEELKKRLDADAALRDAFEALTPGRRKGYLLTIGQAKLAKTREARVEKAIPRILKGLGPDD
ncbi:MAG: hypothetical protein GX418_13110 [Clostridiales bacterium]|nr:hypothetical protein [Clostridiales bacterium]